jgi:hypothetical protein
LARLSFHPDIAKARCPEQVPGVDGETRSDAEIACQRAEEVARKAANLAWLSAGFEYAKQVGALGVMVIAQADLNFNNEQYLSDPRSWDAFPDYINALRDAALPRAGGLRARRQPLLQDGQTVVRA